jgi:hypothetical protein
MTQNFDETVTPFVKIFIFAKGQKSGFVPILGEAVNFLSFSSN